MLNWLGKALLVGAAGLMATPALACEGGCLSWPSKVQALGYVDAVSGYTAYEQSSYASEYSTSRRTVEVSSYGADGYRHSAQTYVSPPSGGESWSREGGYASSADPQGYRYADQGGYRYGDPAPYAHDRGHAPPPSGPIYGYPPVGPQSQGYGHERYERQEDYASQRSFESSSSHSYGYGEQAQGHQGGYAPALAGGPPCPHGAGERVLTCVYTPLVYEQVRLNDGFFGGGGGVGPDYIAGGGGGGGGYYSTGGGMVSAGARASAYAGARVSASASARVSVSGGGRGHGGGGKKGGGCGCH